MDPKVIEQKQMVERYMLGRLPPPEARFFEQMMRESPDLAEQLGIPDALKRTMRLLDETDTEWREQPPRFWHQPVVPLALAALLLLALVISITLWSGKRHVQARFDELRHEAERGLLLAPTKARVMKIAVARPDAAAGSYPIGTRAAPTLVELHLNIPYATGAAYALTIKRDDGTYWARLDNLLRDSNGDLRLTVNSGAFAAGFYDVEIEATNLRGQSTLAGHLRLRVDAD